MFSNPVSSVTTSTTFDRNTFIGFNVEEIKKTSTEELIIIKKSIVGYLKSTKLKKRNANFYDVFKRISRELKKRTNPNYKYEESTTTFAENNSTKSKAKASSSVSKISFLKKKSIDIDIPSFFNDKKELQALPKLKNVVYNENKDLVPKLKLDNEFDGFMFTNEVCYDKELKELKAIIFDEFIPRIIHLL